MHIPNVGDSVVARRKIKSTTLPNTICGPVVESFDNKCRIVTNEGTEIEGNFILYFHEYNFQFLHLTKDSFEDGDEYEIWLNNRKSKFNN